MKLIIARKPLFQTIGFDAALLPYGQATSVSLRFIPPKARGRWGFGGGRGSSGPSRKRIARCGLMSQRFSCENVPLGRDPDPAMCAVTEAMLLSEIKRAKAAKEKHSGCRTGIRGGPWMRST
jgi:hypothetical protein